MNKESYRKKIDEAIVKFIGEIKEKFREHPFFFVNEEDIRCELYHRISSFNHEIYFQNVETKKKFVSNSIHVDAFVGKIKPDLLIYFAQNSNKIPIPSGSVKDSKKDKVHFFQRNTQNENNNHKRILVEIKFINHTSGISKKRKKAIKKDIVKLKNCDHWKGYFIFFDMGNKLDDYPNFKSDMIKLMEKGHDRQGGDIEFYYLGFPLHDGNKKGKYLHLENGNIRKMSSW